MKTSKRSKLIALLRSKAFFRQISSYWSLILLFFHFKKLLFLEITLSRNFCFGYRMFWHVYFLRCFGAVVSCEGLMKFMAVVVCTDLMLSDLLLFYCSTLVAGLFVLVFCLLESVKFCIMHCWSWSEFCIFLGVFWLIMFMAWQQWSDLIYCADQGALFWFELLYILLCWDCISVSCFVSFACSCLFGFSPIGAWSLS